MRNEKYRGFTLIELLVVFAILFIGSTAGIASFRRFGGAKALDTAAAEVESLLNSARISAVTQTFPRPPIVCNSPLQKYSVRITSNQAYEMRVCCNGVRSTINSKRFKLPTGVTFTVNSDEIFFAAATGIPTSPVCTSTLPLPADKTIILTGTGGPKTIKIDTAGNITR